MRGHTPLSKALEGFRATSRLSLACRQSRSIQISAAPTTETPRFGGDDARASLDTIRDTADARFEVLGSPYSLLSVTLSPSQKLFTRRGTLVAVAGKPDNAHSTLSMLNPLTRAPFGVPFLYQQISAASPITALISTKSPTTTFTVLHLDGTTDWILAQRNALLAWTGHTLSLASRIQRNLSLAYWGSTMVTGRGLAALSAPGQIYQLSLAEGESFVAHPASVVAYSVSRTLPLPYRFQSSSWRLQVPSLTTWLPETEFMKNMRKTDTFKFLGRVWHALRTMARRSLWGDRLFLQFTGPATLLLSSRGARMTDMLSDEQVNEIAAAPAGTVRTAVGLDSYPGSEQVAKAPSPAEQSSTGIHIASVKPDGKVAFEDAKDLKEFVR